MLSTTCTTFLLAVAIISNPIADVHASKIDTLDVPLVIRNGTGPIDLICIYDVKADENGLVVKWYHDLDQIYQWIPPMPPQDLGVINGFAEYPQANLEHPNSRSVIRLKMVTVKMAGEYTCAVSTFQEEDSKKTTMIVYGNVAIAGRRKFRATPLTFPGLFSFSSSEWREVVNSKGQTLNRVAPVRLILIAKLFCRARNQCNDPRFVLKRDSPKRNMRGERSGTSSSSKTVRRRNRSLRLPRKRTFKRERSFRETYSFRQKYYGAKVAGLRDLHSADRLQTQREDRLLSRSIVIAEEQRDKEPSRYISCYLHCYRLLLRVNIIIEVNKRYE